MSIAASTIASLLLSGGAGAGIVALVTPIIQHIGHRSESRAHAADLIAEAAGNISDRQDKIIERLDLQILAMRTAIIALTDEVDRVLPEFPLVTLATQLKRVNNEAKKSIF
jgi:hypothetical protein